LGVGGRLRAGDVSFSRTPKLLGRSPGLKKSSRVRSGKSRGGYADAWERGEQSDLRFKLLTES